MPQEAVAYCYDLFDGYTFYMHNIFHDIFAFDKGETLNQETIVNTLANILEENSHTYKEIIGKLTLAQKQTLAAIARDRIAEHPTSGAFVNTPWGLPVLYKKRWLHYWTINLSAIGWRRMKSSISSLTNTWTSG